MNFFILHRRSVRAFALGGLLSVLAAIVGCGHKPPPAAAAAPKPAAAPAKGKFVAAATAADTNQYVSVFEDLLPPKGKDPFFPDSTRRNPKLPEHTGIAVHVEPELVLKAVIRTSRLSQAVVNNAILEVGEPPESVHVPSGRVMVRCLEIGDNYAVVQVQGEAGPKRLTMERKKN